MYMYMYIYIYIYNTYIYIYIATTSADETGRPRTAGRTTTTRTPRSPPRRCYATYDYLMLYRVALVHYVILYYIKL